MGLLSLFRKKKVSHLSLGELGEKIVIKEMKKMGFEILKVNYSVHKVGEIDIIARDGSCLAFVEVKTRRNTEYSRPGEAVNREKQKKLWKTSRAFLRELGNPKIRFRFDVAEVYYKNRFSNQIMYLSNAFNVEMINQKHTKYKNY